MASLYAIPGAAGTIQVGTVTTGAPGAAAAVSNSGTPTAAILNFTLPKGDAGTVSAAAAGSATAPGITFATDPNTGIYSPGADQLAISSNGVGRLFIDASGNVGIGAASAGTAFSVTSSDQLAIFSSGNANAYLRATATTNDTAFGADSTGGFFAVVNSAPLLFKTDNTERLRITSDGKLGLGTSSPSVLLQSQQTNAGSSVIGCSVVNNSDVAGTGVIFDLTPSFAGPGVRGAQIEAVNTNGLNEISLALKTSSGGNPATRLHITPAGNVGIGTTSPLGNLHIEGPATSAGWQLRLDSVGLTNESGFYRTASDNYEMVLRNAAGGLSYLTNTGGASTSTLEFVVQGSERARIDSSGRLLIGTSSSVGDTFGASQFQVSGTDGNTFSSGRYSNDAFAPIVYLRKSRGSLGTQGLVSSGDGLGILAWTGSDGAGFIQGASIKAEVDGTPGANDMPGRLVFSVTADGASSPTEAMRIKNTRVINFSNAPVYADNAAAKTGGLVDGDVYRTSTGDLKIVYT